MFKNSILFVTLLFTSFSISAQEFTFDDSYSPNQLLVDYEELSELQFEAIALLDGEFKWISPITQTALLYIDFSDFPEEGILINLNDGDDEIFVLVQDIIDVNTGVVKAPTNGGRDNYDYKIKASPIPPSNDQEIAPLQQFSYPIGYRNTKVGIFDTGFNQIGNDTPSSSGGYDYINESDQVVDDNNHGTHLASIMHSISGFSDNVISYYNYKILDENGSGNISNIIIAVEEAIFYDQVQICNLSLSALNSWGVSLFLKKLMREIETKDLLLVVSAGNNSADLNSSSNYVMPASLESTNIITVASLGEGKKVAPFTNYGPGPVDILTVGINIEGIDRYGENLVYSGTSQSTAVVTAVASILGSYQGEEFSGSQIKCAIMTGAHEDVAYAPFVTSSGKLSTTGAANVLRSGPCTITYGHDTDFRSQKELSYNSVYPNPTADNIVLNLAEGAYKVKVNDAMGRQLIYKDITSSGEHTLNEVSSFVPGLYTLTIQNSQTNNSETIRFIKN